MEKKKGNRLPNTINYVSKKIENTYINYRNN